MDICYNYFIAKILQFEKNYCHAWINLAKIEFSTYNYYKAFMACLECLKINNQYKESLDFYQKLRTNPHIQILSKIRLSLQKLGHFSAFGHYENEGKPTQERKYIQYQQSFINFLKEIDKTDPNDDIVTIYGWIPKCKECNKPLRLHNSIINHKAKIEFIFYKCSICGHQERQEIHLGKESKPYIKILVILKSSAEKPKHLKLTYENFYITYSTAGSVPHNLLSRLKNAVRLYRANKECQVGF